jgi:hypothetical protein
MRGFILFALILVSVPVYCQDDSDSTRHPLKVSGTISFNTNGMAAVPAFAYGKPVISSSISFKKNRFSFDPQYSYGLNIKPWILDNWFHYMLVVQPKFELGTGVNVSMFFSELKTPDEDVWRGQRYSTLELAGKYKLPNKRSLGLMFWYDIGLDPGTIKGYFLNFVFEQTDIRIGNQLLFAANVQTFYIDYTGLNDGLFISPTITLSRRHFPVSIYCQGLQAITSNMSPFPSFQVNFGIGYSF